MQKSSALSKPAFLITIDTEGDNLWARSQTITTENARFLGRFQSLCEKYNLRPTWLTNWEMTQSPVFVEFAQDVIARDAGEIGMHLHAWNSPPIVPLTEDDNQHHPYLFEYPQHVIREKVKVMTRTLEEIFNIKVVSHRAGRFGFDEVYARVLAEFDYLVDGSVTPNINWQAYPGDPNGTGGKDFSNFPEQAYFLDLDDISQPGQSKLLEIPVTVGEPYYHPVINAFRSVLRALPLGKKVSNQFFPSLAWLYPKGDNHRSLQRLLMKAPYQRRDFAEFMIHSSELMPGGSPNFPGKDSIEGLYDVLESLFAAASEGFEPLTMQQYYSRFTGSSANRSTAGAAA